MNTRFKTIGSEIINRPDIIAFLDSVTPICKLFDLPSNLSKDRIRQYKSLYEGIGETPVYQVTLPGNNRLHIKSEYYNTMGNSHYSRLWIPYLFIAEVLNVIIPKETHLIEVTTGNSGIALAMACHALNYPLTLVIPSLLPNGRVFPMKKYGANIIMVDGYIKNCIYQLRREIVTKKLFPCNHSEEIADVQVKLIKRIAVEYVNDLGTPDFAFLGLGNGTSTVAIFDYFKKKNSSVKTISFHPDPNKNDLVLGLYRPISNLRHLEPALKLTDDIIFTSDRDLNIVKTNFIHDTEITNFGHSSLYAINIAMEYAKTEMNKTFFTIAYDKIDRYV